MYCVVLVAGMLAAPFPFITGIHTSYLQQHERDIGEETVRVYLDVNHIDFGTLGATPTLPDRGLRKLQNEVAAAGHIFELRGDAWKEDRQPFFDDGFSSTSDHPGSCSIKGRDKVDEALRAAFLKIFVTMFKDYRRY
jgi:hypothetical protein